MKHKLLHTLGLIVLGLVAFGASPAHATTAAGPYYAMPSWDQTLACDTTATCPRFIVLSNMGSAAVLDRETGLVWEQSPSTNVFAWEDAQGHCNRLTTGGRLGWRLPTLQELASLVDPTVPFPGPTLPAGHPFSNVQSSFYWSATTNAGFTSVAWGVYFFSGVVTNVGLTNSLFVWCVRGGQGVDAQ